jgi:hypothetical protein
LGTVVDKELLLEEKKSGFNVAFCFTIYVAAFKGKIEISVDLVTLFQSKNSEILIRFVKLAILI